MEIVTHEHDNADESGSLEEFRKYRERNCVTYHLTRCAEEGVTRPEIFETMSVGLVVGGSIVIPHLRRAVDRWTQLEGKA